jgi:NADPH2:quinone reductase
LANHALRENAISSRTNKFKLNNRVYSMQVVQFSEHGNADVLQLVDLPTPRPKAGEVLIKVAAAGVNYADIWQRKGNSPTPIPLPYVPGYEVAGTIAALGDGVTTVQVGQRVMAMLANGGYAEYVVARATQVISLPAALGYAQATALLAQGPTAVGLLNTGMYASVLVLAAAGGVGSLLVQVAKNRGARVVAAVGSEAKKAAAQASGADVVVSYAEADWVQQVRTATDGLGVAAAFDAVGGRVGAEALLALGAGGTAVVYGAASGEPTVVAAQQLIGQRQVVRGYTVFAELARLGEYTQELLGYFQAGNLQLPVQTYSIAAVQTAHRDLEARQTQGKVVLLF